jgi:hypothetical protein
MSFIAEPPTPIARDLLLYYQKPTILFLHTNGPQERLLEEAESLCFQNRTISAVNSLHKYLESLPVPGDGVLSSCLAEWHRARFEELKTEPRHLHLFDPSKLVVNIVENLVAFLNEINKLDVRNKTIVIPLDFVRAWQKTVTNDILSDSTFIKTFI